jgi:hypothetical protein
MIARAVRMWGNRTLATAWTSWQQLMAWSKENQQVAQDHAHRLLAYLTVAAWEGWRAWHARQGAKAEIVAHYSERLHNGTRYVVKGGSVSQSVGEPARGPVGLPVLDSMPHLQVTSAQQLEGGNAATQAGHAGAGLVQEPRCRCN